MSLSEKLEAACVALGKRKERDSKMQAVQPQPLPMPPKAKSWKQASDRAAVAADNKLLAGHLAHEFLTHGTLLGLRIEPQPKPDLRKRYAEVSWLLMASGAHIPGVVNPTQLGRWLQIKD